MLVHTIYSSSRKELNKRNKELRSLKRDLSYNEWEIGRVLSSVDKFILHNVVKKNVDKITKTIMKAYEKKLKNLTKTSFLTIHYCRNCT